MYSENNNRCEEQIDYTTPRLFDDEEPYKKYGFKDEITFIGSMIKPMD
jgi:hypothetical protein